MTKPPVTPFSGKVDPELVKPVHGPFRRSAEPGLFEVRHFSIQGERTYQIPNITDGDQPAATIIERMDEAVRVGEAVRRAVDECWDELVNKDDRTSPEEYPDMALITKAELQDYCRRAAIALGQARDAEK